MSRALSVLAPLLVFFAIVGAVLAVPPPANAGHSAPITFSWDAYYLGSPSKWVDWKHCNMNSYQWNIAGIAFNNWNAKFQQGTGNSHLGSGCSFSGGAELVVQGQASSAMEIECGLPVRVACYRAEDISGVYYNSWCPCLVLQVTTASIVFDVFYWNDLWHPTKQMHIFAHEFGHGMGLDDPHACGESVMSHGGCLDLVHGWPPFPNDVCSPDIIFGYSAGSGGRCQ